MVSSSEHESIIFNDLILFIPIIIFHLIFYTMKLKSYSLSCHYAPTTPKTTRNQFQTSNSSQHNTRN
jgi:hypothetical protein